MITSIMSLLSVPLTPELEKDIQYLISGGIALNKADAARKAIKHYAEMQAVQDVLRAEKEPGLTGDLDELASKL